MAVGSGGRLRRFLAFAGPAYLVSVGYMDPGNWATDLAGGSRYGYALLWVILASSLMAVLLQTLCVRMGLAMEKDLAQACRDYYEKPVAIALWILCEIAIVACDVAEVIGSAVGLNLLFGMPLAMGVLVTGFDVLLLLALTRFGFRKIEAIVVTLVATIFLCFAINMVWARPDWLGVAHGLVTPSLPDSHALLVAVGILGATVMPHNLYLHSAIVQTRQVASTPGAKRSAMRMSTVDTVVALSGAFLVNAAILVLAAAVFHGKGSVVEELQQAYKLLTPTLGAASATLFAVALLASGQSSTITATLAGQVVMEGFTHFRMAAWKRRLITRSLALIPAVILVSTASNRTTELLVLTQVVLSMQLPFAIFPLVMFTSDKNRMGEFVNPAWLSAIAYLVCGLITALNVKLLWDSVGTAWLAAIILSIAGFAMWAQYVYKPASTAYRAR
ncbi:Manganese transport protein MntH [Fimbriimonas ginsengisoli Gsoil 348]|uniref:Divalent metal cation transporter MntH n=1 Tax=Fimbriimonas ginsengisoli Gsoil 348 TaxID=661478 RepID=A0A068NYB2_FIMGI|nr:Manganese transport protein MntH [Fimbriimonas ginsengisoli Gsoil 348]